MGISPPLPPCRFVKKLEHSWKALVHDGVSGKWQFLWKNGSFCGKMAIFMENGSFYGKNGTFLKEKGIF